MSADNIGQERYCPREDSWLATWGPGEKPDEHHCAVCSAAVVYNPTVGESPVRLVCLDCLHLGAIA